MNTAIIPVADRTLTGHASVSQAVRDTLTRCCACGGPPSNGRT